MRPKNLVAEVLVCIFTIVSFTIYAITTMTDNTVVSYLSVLIYMIPQLIYVTNDFSKEFLNPILSKISVYIIGIGSIVIAVWLALISSGIQPPFGIKVIVVIVSSIFMFHPIYSTIVEIKKHYNIHKSLNSSFGG